ncbi:MAG: heterodisulfide reductase-related iron-sulfur binding cluster [Candidatus Bathyarchaeia archaeon]
MYVGTKRSEKLRIKAFEDYISWCKNCKFCREAIRYAEPFGYTREICPFKDYTSGFTSIVGASGKMLIARGLLYEALKPTPAMAEDVYLCTTCGACKQWCGALVDTVGVIEALRADLVDSGVGPMKEHKEFAERIRKYYNPYDEPPEKRFAWIPSQMKLPKKADVVYFVGCTSALRLPELATSTVKLLQTAKVDFTVLPEEVCCGSVMFRTGFREVAVELAEKVVQMIEDTGASTVVFSCPGCFRTFSSDYPEVLGRPLRFELKHVSQLLLEMDGLKFVKPLNVRVTYHDPCHLGRHLGVYGAPRDLINQIPGLELVEMERVKAGAFCCGAGGGVRGAFPDISLSIAGERVREAAATGAEILTSACPFCKRNLEDASLAAGGTLKVQDIVELALTSIEER